MLSFVMAAPVLGHILPFYDIKHGGKGIAATFGCFLGLLPHWIPLCVLAGIFIFFSCVVKINPNYYRTVATYILATICTVWLEPNRYIVFGFLLIAASVLAKLFMSAEEKEHFEVKLAWKH
jgi:glycerol-3-phosphate acyltransferase PlsY